MDMFEDVFIYELRNDCGNTLISLSKEIIEMLINECNVTTKTDLLLGGLEVYDQDFDDPNNDISYLYEKNLRAFLYYKCFIACTIDVDNGYEEFSRMYYAWKEDKPTEKSIPKNIMIIIEIFDLINRGISYIGENPQKINKDYFKIVEKKIRAALANYEEDEDICWNKIN